MHEGAGYEGVGYEDVGYAHAYESNLSPDLHSLLTIISTIPKQFLPRTLTCISTSIVKYYHLCYGCN